MSSGIVTTHAGRVQTSVLASHRNGGDGISVVSKRTVQALRVEASDNGCFGIAASSGGVVTTLADQPESILERNTLGAMTPPTFGVPFSNGSLIERV